MPDRPVTHSEADVMLAKSFGFEHSYEKSPPLPREIALLMIRRAVPLSGAPPWFVSTFTDFDEISENPDNRREAVLALEYARMISGWNGKIHPHDTVTRAEFAAMLSKLICVFIDEDTDFESAELERVVIRRPGITVKNLTAEYAVIAAYADGVTLEGCDMGTVRMYAGADTVYLAGTSIAELYKGDAGSGVISDEDSIVEQIRAAG
jgi:hypothetical protein